MGKQYEGLQLARAFAALIVVCFHFTPHLPSQLHSISHWGFFGVDVFFVLSGFVVAMNSESIVDLANSGRFLVKRSLRIYLGYWPALVLWVIVVKLLSNQYPNVDHIWSSLFLTQTSMAKQWLPVAWSLAYEMLFYFMASAVIAVLHPRHRLSGYACLFFVLLMWNMYWLVGRHDEVLAGVQPWRSILSAYGLEFLAGAMLACVRTHLRWHPAWLPVLLGTAGLGFSVGSFSDWFDKVELLRAGSFGLIGVSMVILGWLLPLEAPGPHSKTARVLLRIGVEVGNASFALYLLHPMLIELGLFAAKRWGWITAENHLFLFFLFPTCVLLAWIWYRYFERPLYDSAVKFFISRPRSDDRYIVTTTKTQ